METFSGKVTGKVQGVMFRQTLMRALITRNLQGGATNHKEKSDEVSFTVTGEPCLIIELIQDLKSGKELNSWGAKVDCLEELENITPVSNHEVTTDNVDQIKWSQGVEFYL